MGKFLLTQNSELRPLGVFNWTIPALSAVLSDGQRVNTCPAAGICATLCYARTNTYRFSNVLAAHTRNLELVVTDLASWEQSMIEELTHRRYRSKWVRIHDAGDFFSDEYLEAWLRIAAVTPDVTFYAYTREVSRFRRCVEQGQRPDNFMYLFSLGGKEDKLIDLVADRHCDVFPSLEAATVAGYSSQHEDDRHSVTLPTNQIAVIANPVKKLRNKQKQRTFRELQAAHEAGERIWTTPEPPSLFD
jgi:hypothetical protein